MNDLELNPHQLRQALNFITHMGPFGIGNPDGVKVSATAAGGMVEIRPTPPVLAKVQSVASAPTPASQTPPASDPQAELIRRNNEKIDQVLEARRVKRQGIMLDALMEWSSNVNLQCTSTESEYVAEKLRAAGLDPNDATADLVMPTGNDKYESEYRSNPHLRAQMSLADYIATRRVDDGLDVLKPAGVA